MPRKLDPAIADVLKSFGFGPEACWDCHGTWVVYHHVLEQIAAKAGIVFDPPMVLQADGAAKVAAICVTGRSGARAEWSIGEAAPGNNKNSYPFAMAEKRAKDRVILKLVGLHGLAYSEDESDTFKPAANSNGSYTAKLPPELEPDPHIDDRIASQLIRKLSETTTMEEYRAWRADANTQNALADLGGEAFERVKAAVNQHLEKLQKVTV